MADRPWEIEINEDTPSDKLELFALSADRSSDTNIQKKASEAKVELKWRDRAYEREQWAHRFRYSGGEVRERPPRALRASSKVLIWI